MEHPLWHGLTGFYIWAMQNDEQSGRNNNLLSNLDSSEYVSEDDDEREVDVGINHSW